MTYEKYWLLIKILEVPDLTLTKYNSAGMKGIDSMLEFHREFLRQWSRKGILSDISLHLFYNYDSRKVNGNRMGVYVGFWGTSSALSNALSLIRSSSLFAQYHFEIVRTPGFVFTDRELKVCGLHIYEEKGGEIGTSDPMQEWDRLCNYEYTKCCMLTKKEIIISLDGDAEENYYTVAGWEPNETCRLQQLYRLFQTFNETLLLRVDVYPVDWQERIKKAFRKPVTRLRNRQKEYNNLVASKDYSIDTILKSYEDITKNMDRTLQFRVNVFAFGPSLAQGKLCDDVEMILATLAAESIGKGNYAITDISHYGKNYGTFSFLNDTSPPLDVEDDRSRTTKVFRKSNTGYELVDKRCETNILRFLSTTFTLEELEPFFRLPILDENDNIEIRKETTPAVVSSDGGLFLGIDDNGYEVNFPLKILAKHAFIAGVPGSGKTNMMHHLTSTLWLKHKIPFLVFEPAKQEYRALANQPGMEDLCIFSPNADMLFPLHINPFEFPKGLMLSEHIRQLESVFEGAFPLDNPMPFLLDTAIESIYRELGWKPETINSEGLELQFPTMSMLYSRLEEELNRTTYSDEISGNLKSALQVRIGSLLRREMGGIFDVPKSTFEPEEWLKRPAVIELEAMGTGPANFTTLLLCTLIRESLKVNPYYAKNHARHVIFIEEAHNLIGPQSEVKYGNEADPKQAATAFVVKMLAEVRALKEAIVIADQLPTVMADEVIKNTGLKIGLRITSSDDRALLCSTMSASPVQMEAMGTFNVGRALVSYEGLQKPFVMQTHEWLGKGDDAYIEDKGQREYMTTPKRDWNLMELMRDRPVYVEITRKSFIIELMKFRNRFDDYEARVNRSIKFFKELRQQKLRILKLREEINDRILQFSGMDIGQREIVQLDEMNRRLEVWEKGFEQSRKSNYYIDSYKLCEEAAEIVVEIADRKSHWNRIGLRTFEKLDEKDYIGLIRQLQSGILQCSKKLYAYAMEYFTADMRENIEMILKVGEKQYIIE